MPFPKNGPYKLKISTFVTSSAWMAEPPVLLDAPVKFLAPSARYTSPARPVRPRCKRVAAVSAVVVARRGRNGDLLTLRRFASEQLSVARICGSRPRPACIRKPVDVRRHRADGARQVSPSRTARSRDVLLANYRGAAQVTRMPRRPATITQADVARVIRAARQAGAAEVEVRLGDGAQIIVRLSTSGATALEESGKIVL